MIIIFKIYIAPLTYKMIRGAEHVKKHRVEEKDKEKRLVTRPVPKQKYGDTSVPPTEN